MLDEIAKEWINQELDSRIWQFDINGEVMGAVNRFSVNPFKRRLGDYPLAPVAPSSFFCPDHNPNRSNESRRAYQNHRKRIADFENEINRLYNHPTESRFANDSDNDLQALLQKAYDNVFPSTLDRIKKLKKEGKKQVEIAKILQVSRQVVSIALKREKSKALEA